MLVKVSAAVEQRSKIIEISDIFRCRIIDISPDTLTIEATGSYDKIEGLLQMLRPYGLLELARTGLVAMERGSAVLKVDL
jgi:acetolactate synthase-1/3 small subunit